MPSFLEHLKNLATNSGIPGADKLTAPEILKLAAASTAVVVVSVVTTTLLIGSYIDFTQVAAPAAPAAGVTRAYGKTDGKLYKKTSDGVEVEVGGGGDLSNLNATNLTSGTVPDARFPATLPASSGVNLTALNASNLGSGTVPDARFPAALPASSGVNLTALNASNLGSGTATISRGGTGATTLGTSRQPVLGNGTSALTALSAPGTDDANADSVATSSTTGKKIQVYQGKASRTVPMMEFQGNTGQTSIALGLDGLPNWHNLCYFEQRGGTVMDDN